jgi:hypothetical protein
MLLLHFLVEFLEPFELRREAAFGGCVDDQDHFAFEFDEREGLAFLIEGFKVVEGCCGGHVA